MIKQTISQMVFRHRCYLLVFILLVLSVSFCSGASSLNKRPKVGLVLSGGGAKGLAHIGVLKIIDSLNIPIDYVGGTSMGSVVGGLYAIGYSAKEIEQMALSQDWIDLLTDRVQRTNFSVWEKEDYDRYMVSFPFDSLQFKLPSGLGAGQNISMLLSRMAIPVSEISDFSKFERPFVCVATDIVNGKEVVLREGYLPDAIRASMAIPTIFTPVSIGGKYLVDGGLINNFPVDRVKEMGADIIIGVNLGLKEYSKKDLENLAAVLEQSLFFHAKDRNKANRKLCDVLLMPDVYESNAGSFANVEELIKLGESVAHKSLDELKLLLDSLQSYGEINYARTMRPVDTLFVSDIEFTGLKKVTSRFLEGKLRLRVPGKVSVDQLERGIQRAYGTLFFKKITYKTESTGIKDSVKIILRVQESNNNLVRVGARFDSYFKAQLLLNATFRNTIVPGSKLSFDIYMGMYPRFKTEYRFNTGWKPNDKNQLFRNDNFGVLPDFGIRAEFRDLNLDYYENYDLLSSYRYQYGTVGGFMSTSINNPLYVEAGVDYDFSFVKPLIKTGEEPMQTESLHFYGKMILDSYDNQVHPHKGSYGIFWFDFIRELSFPGSNFINTYMAGLNIEKVSKINRFTNIQPYLKLGFAIGDTISPLRKMLVGGNIQRSYLSTSVYSFPGLRFMQVTNNTMYIGGVKLRFNYRENHYLTVDNSFGRTSETIHDILTSLDHYLYGFGLTYGYKSLVGPVEIGVYKGNVPNPWLLFINFGYWF